MLNTSTMILSLNVLNMSGLSSIIYKKYGEEKYWEKMWYLENKYQYLCENINKNREFLDDFIDREKFEKNILKIADFILEEIGFYRKDGGYNFRGETTMFDLSEYMEPDVFRSTLGNYNLFGSYNRFFDVFHGYFSDLKHAVENFDKLNFKSGKGKNKTRDLMRDIVTYYRDVLLARKWIEKKMIAKRDWKRSKKHTFAFDFDAKGTNWTSDWYDNVSKKGCILITAKNEEQAKNALVSKEYDCIIKTIIDCHRLDGCSLTKLDLTQDVIQRWKDQQKDIGWRYRPYLLFLIK